jgi:para-nitrobenzyl esterase
MPDQLSSSKINMIKLQTLLFFCCIFLFIACDAQNPILKISNGYIKGTRENGTLVFKGIPYAKPPVGQLRFKAPQPAGNWADTLSCQNFGNIASQYDGTKKGLKGDEDCLTLNVYTPAVTPKTKLPVLIWIHGGAMTAGSGKDQNGHAFSDQDSVITITINYRLGIFGFMYMGDQQKDNLTSGNNGLLDCIMALKWVKENIASFGGDPSKVTVTGESAGAKLASVLLVSPQAKGYFHQLILESGSLQCVRDTVTAKMIRQRLMDTLKLRQPADLLKLTAEQLIGAQEKVCNGAQGTNYFGPVEDGSTISGDPYLYLKQNPNRDIRILMGTNKYESKMFMGFDKRLYHPDQKVLTDWFGNNNRYVLTAYQKTLKTTDTTTAAMTVLTQYMYQMHSYRLADVLARNGNPVWMYRFDYSRDDSGASHAQELPYVWFAGQNQQFNDQEVQLARQVHKAWVNFINGRKPGHLNQYDWSWYQPRARSIMVFDHMIHPELLKEIYNDHDYPSEGFLLN